MFLPDGEDLADQLIAVLMIVEHEHERPVELDQPAEPAGEDGPQHVRERALGVAGGERAERATEVTA